MQNASVNLNDYTDDDYPRSGCTLVVNLTDTGWQLSVYAPGFEPVGHVGKIESFARRKHGSLGIALDAFAAGKTMRSVFPAMARAERAYQAELDYQAACKAQLSSGDAVTL